MDFPEKFSKYFHRVLLFYTAILQNCMYSLFPLISLFSPKLIRVLGNSTHLQTPDKLNAKNKQDPALLRVRSK